jgi:Tfp pilus assembly protein PilF
MTARTCIAQLALATGLSASGFFAQAAFAQKAPAPPPSPTPAPVGRPTSPGNQPGFPNPNNPQLGIEPSGGYIMFLYGRVATDDGAPLPSDVKVERVCNARVRQQVYANSKGDFSMQLGSMVDSFVDATGDGPSQVDSSNRYSNQGIPRRELSNCELRADVSGFRSNIISLVDLNDFGDTADVGAIVVERRNKVQGATVSVASYQTPANARRVYERGLDAARQGKLAEAQQYFEKSVAIYPKYTSAWFQLGTVLQLQNRTEPARNAFTRATTIDPQFLPPFLSLSLIAFEAGNWTDVLNLTGHILYLDPLNYTRADTYVLDLDPLDFAEAYFYNAVANYNLNKFVEAEKSLLKAERLDVRPRFPQLHVMLAELYARKNNYPAAAAEVQIYLELVPHAKNADKMQEWLAQLQKLIPPAPPAEKANRNQ